METLILAITISLTIGFVIGATLALNFGPEVIKSDMQQLRLMYANLQVKENAIRREQQLISIMRLSVEKERLTAQPTLMTATATAIIRNGRNKRKKKLTK